MSTDEAEPARIGDRPFVDGVTREVFADPDGRQFVLDNDGNPVYGVWIYVPEPVNILTESPALGSMRIQFNQD